METGKILTFEQAFNLSASTIRFKRFLFFEYKVLGYYDSKNHPRKSSSKAFKLDLEAVRPDPLIPLEEYR